MMSDISDKPDRGGIQVIARAAAILRVLRDDPSGLSLGQIAERVELPRSTVQRITGALATERFVISDQRRGGLRLGPEIGALAEAARFDTVEWCRPLLRDLATETGETTDLALYRNGMMVFVDQVAGAHRLRAISSIGDSFPLTTTANGRACLALLPEGEARRVIAAELAHNGREGDLEIEMARLTETRHSGLAHDYEEHSLGISAVGIAFRDWSQDIYAISIPVPTSRFTEARPLVEAALLRVRPLLENF